MQTLIKYHILRPFIWFLTVCQSNGLKVSIPVCKRLGKVKLYVVAAVVVVVVKALLMMMMMTMHFFNTILKLKQCQNSSNMVNKIKFYSFGGHLGCYFYFHLM